jgi:uncharacterized membrane protein
VDPTQFGMMDKRTKAVFIIHLAATMFMVGVIWFVQIVHYPLFGAVGDTSFAAYSEAHSRLTTFVVAPPMIAELATAILLFFFRPPGISASVLWLGLGLVGVVWLSTAFLQVPRHAALELGFDGGAHEFLVASNWVRTVAWSLRGGLSLWMAAKILH